MPMSLIGFGAFTPASSLLDGSESDGTNILDGGSGMTSDWLVLGATQTTAATTAPDGTTTALRFTDTTDNDRHIIYQARSTSQTTGVFSVYAKQDTLRYLQFMAAAGSGNHKAYLYVDLQIGAITDSGGLTSATVTSSSIQAAVNGFWKITMHYDLFGSYSDVYYQMATSNVATYGAPLSLDSPTYAGTDQSIYLWRPKVVL